MIEALENNHKLFNDILDAIPDIAWLKDANGVYLMCNREFAKLVNSSKEQIIGATDFDIFPAKKADFYRKNDLQVIEDGIPITNEESANYVTSGDSILLETTRTPICDKQGELIGVLGIGRDICRSKEALQESLRKQKFLNLVLESSPVPMWIGSPDGTTLRANQALYSALNLTPEQIVGRYNLLQDDNLKRADIDEKIDLVFNEKQSVKFDLEWKIDRAGDADFSGGRDLYIDVTIFPLLNQNGEITHIVVQWIDVTDHIKAEEFLKVQERFISAIADTSPAIIYVYDLKSNRNVYINTGMERLLGYSANEIRDLGENILSNLVHPDDFPNVLKIHSEISTATDEAVHAIEYRIKHRDGTWRYLHSDERIFIRDSDGSVKQKIGVAYDITERKTLEDNFSRSEARYRKAQEIGRVGNWEYNLKTGQFWGSDEAKKIYGFDPREQDFTTEEVENCIPDRENVHQALIDLIEREQPYNLEFEIITKDTGESKFIQSIAALEKDAKGDPVKVAGVILDITEHKRIEEELLESKSRLTEAQYIANMGDFLWNVNTGEVTWSEGLYDLLGYDKSEKIDLKKVNFEIHHPDDLEKVTRWLKECLESGKSSHPPKEYRLIHKDGRTIDVRTYVSVKYRDGKPYEVFGTVQDISMLKKAREALHESESYLSNAVEMAKLGYWELDVNNGMFTFPIVSTLCSKLPPRKWAAIKCLFKIMQVDLSIRTIVT